MKERTKDLIFVWALAAAFAAMVLVALSSVGTCAEPDPWLRYRSVVEIRVNQGRAASWTGSGTLVAKRDGMGLVLSCRHVCTRVGLQVDVVWHGSKKQKVKGYVAHVVPGVASDWGSDIALVLAPCPDSLVPVPVAKFDPRNGPWYGVGYRSGRFLESVATDGSARESALIFNRGYLGGMSGGCVFDRYGRQVGIVVASNAAMTVGWAADGVNLERALSQFGR